MVADADAKSLYRAAVDSTTEEIELNLRSPYDECGVPCLRAFTVNPLVTPDNP